MGMQTYSTVASRNLIRAAVKMLWHAGTVEVLGKFGRQEEQPLNKTDTIVYRRLVPFGASQAANPATGGSNVPVVNPNSFILAEGVTPNANTISYQDVSVTLQNFGLLFKFSDKAQLMYEDNIPDDMNKLCGETLGEVVEKVRWGVIRSGTAVIYANGTTRAGINTGIGASVNKFKLAVRSLQSNRVMRITSMIAPGPNFGTKSVQPGYLCFTHTDAEPDLATMPGFTKVEDYGQRKTIDDTEQGAIGRLRFLTTPVLDPFLAAGASVGATGLKSAGGSNVDVYPFVVVGEEAWGQVSLKGYGGIAPVVIPAKERNHANPMGKYGFVGADTWTNAVRLNENAIIRVEAGVADLA